jgi:dipeptidyl aminopeptidase/acylaminoacyl peptidase
LAGCALILAALYWWVRPLPRPVASTYTALTHDGQPKAGLGPLLTDGARIYFLEGIGPRPTLVQISTSGGETAVASNAFQDIALWDVAPDHSQLLFSKSRGLEHDLPLWILALHAGTPSRVDDIVGHDATWLPSGGEISYSSGDALYSAGIDGSHVKKLATVAGMIFQPRWSPDGTVVRFTVSDTKTNSSSIWEVSRDGSNLHPLLPGWNNPPAECCGTWTSDGRYFVFAADRNGKADVWAISEYKSLLRRNHGVPVQITTGPVNFSGPQPSVDGKRLFVVGDQPRGELTRYDKNTTACFINRFSLTSATYV